MTTARYKLLIALILSLSLFSLFVSVIIVVSYSREASSGAIPRVNTSVNLEQGFYLFVYVTIEKDAPLQSINRKESRPINSTNYGPFRLRKMTRTFLFEIWIPVQDEIPQ